MEKHANKSKLKLMKFLPKAANAVVSFQNPPFSPGRAHHNKGYSGTILPMIPVEARRKSKNDETEKEPTSPKVSCMGQIKQKKHCIAATKNKTTKSKPEKKSTVESRPEKKSTVEIKPDLKKKPSKSSSFKNIFTYGRKTDADRDRRGKTPVIDKAPCLSQMRRFASSRDTFANFDWTSSQIAPESDDDFEREEEDFRVPFSAPILRGGGGELELEPRKEINLWKRRTMAQPRPLQLK